MDMTEWAGTDAGRLYAGVTTDAARAVPMEVCGGFGTAYMREL
jgi:hypothetical protein